MLSETVISDVAQLIRGVTYSKADARDTPSLGYAPVLRATNIQDSRLVLESDLVFVPESNVSPVQRLRAGDIVIATSSGSKHLVGKSGLMRTDWSGSFGAFCAALRPKQNIEPRYLSAFLQSPAYWKQVGKKALGVNINNLRRGDIETLSLPLPPLEQQRLIVAEIEKQFSRLDEAVANLKRVKANLKRYKAAVLKAAVEGRLVPTEAELARKEGRDYETGEQLLKRILEARRKDWSGKGKYKTPISPTRADKSDLQVGWTWASLDQLAEVGTGATPNRGRVDYFEDGTVPWVTSAVVNERYVDQASDFVTVKALAETNLTLYPPGTLLVAMYGEGKTRGKCAELRISATTNQALAALQPVGDLTQYLRLFLEFNYEETRKVASGGVQPNLNLGLIRSIRVPLPPREEQIRIIGEVDRRLSLVRGVEVQLDVNFRRAERMRQSILSDAFCSPCHGEPAVLAA